MLTERYLNPFTDFGFKKLFGEEPNKDVLAKLPAQDRAAYEDSLKHLRDLKNVVDYAHEVSYLDGLSTGIEQGIQAGIEKGKIEVAKQLKVAGVDLTVISSSTGLSIDAIRKL